MSWDECMCGQECQKPCIFAVVNKTSKKVECGLNIHDAQANKLCPHNVQANESAEQ